MRKYTFRKLMNDLHLWLGVGSGIILFIVCFTGCILAFEKEIVFLFDKEDYYSEKIGNRVPFDRLIDSLEGNDTIVKDFIFYGEENRNHQFTLLTKKQIEKSKG
ncbi:PepSY domain-containing protein [Maribacter polysiphoniae]|uniref:PepSY domain-containing protein n=1 Tax=Maribacter polysiphoniae TaxID=429344 RepID=A0A316E488_9FLAO|nr:PepSY domain-containing protein [Maribacter polysiphoniae]PWK24362.1 PepSY-associated transmembrane protein [Maribacter polysiphoniae]